MFYFGRDGDQIGQMCFVSWRYATFGLTSILLAEDIGKWGEASCYILPISLSPHLPIVVVKVIVLVMSRINGFIGRRELLKLAGVGGVGLATTGTSSLLRRVQPAQAA